MARRGIDPARLPRLLCVMEPHGTRASGTNRRVQQQYSTPSFVSSPYFGVRKRVVGRSYWNTVGESSFLETHLFFSFVRSRTVTERLCVTVVSDSSPLIRIMFSSSGASPAGAYKYLLAIYVLRSAASSSSRLMRGEGLVSTSHHWRGTSSHVPRTRGEWHKL